MIVKISPDKEKAKSIFNLALDREKFVSQIDENEFPTNVAEGYYEIIKELATAILLIDGLKAIGEYAHKELLDYLRDYGFQEHDILLIDDLRIKRNKSSYEGKKIEVSYLKNKKHQLLEIIDKLIKLVQDKLR